MAESQPFRLDSGGLIDRDKPLRFQFNNKQYSGFEGDSLASALLANGVKVVARSFKYHRPRGIFTSGEEEPCGLVETGSGSTRVPNVRATTQPLEDGLSSRSQKGWPSLDFDVGRIIDFTHGLWPAGFYNKTFKWPGWHTWEKPIRNSAGLGRVPEGPDPDHYERVNWHCDLLICGGGPAGLMAALLAGRAGLRVLLAEQDREFGGSLIKERTGLNDKPAVEWVRSVIRKLNALPNVILLPRTTATGIYDHKVTTLVQTGTGTNWRECYWVVRPKKILLATGAIEQGLIFPSNDRPGIMLSGAVREYLNRYAVVPGRQVVVAGNNDSIYQTAFDLADSNIEVTAVADERENIDTGLAGRLAALGIDLLAGSRIVNSKGSSGIRAVQVRNAEQEARWINCDLLAVSGGWAPRVHLLSHAGGHLKFDGANHCFVPGQTPDGVYVAGQASRPTDLAGAFSVAIDASIAVCQSLDVVSPDLDIPQITADIVCSRHSAWNPPIASGHRQWVDLAHDVTTDDVELAVREGYESVEHFKRYTTAGMSVDQGKTSNTNAFLLLSHLTNKDPADTGTTTFRPPYAPVTAGVIAAQSSGDLYVPKRYLPAHSIHKKMGAKFEDFGWQRPEYYPKDSESKEDSIHREVMGVRSGVGVFDNSPIGKLEVCGPDAAGFLDRLYINNIRQLSPGKARYGLMLNESGVIIDDGVVVSLTEQHFIVHTTSANAHRVFEMMEEWLQCEWTNLKVAVHDATSSWANFTVAGPKSRDVLSVLDSDMDLSPGALPHMSAVSGSLLGLDCRISRVSYSGELSFEVNVPAGCAASILEAIIEAGEPHQITPYGVEALMVMRTEKGYLHVGSDTDGATTPDDVGWGAIARRKGRDFIGRRSLARPANTAGGRKQLVGIEPTDSTQALMPGGHLLLGTDRDAPAITDGWVTSACFSPTLNRYIALAMLRDGQDHLGDPVVIYDQGKRHNARVVAPAFYDPENARLS